MTKFKNAAMQEIYEKARKEIGIRPSRGDGISNAYWVGRKGLPNLLWRRDSLAYAAWAAGRDNRRAAETIRRKSERSTSP